MILIMISLLQLCESLGTDLQPVGNTGVAQIDLTGVHISELDDPTPYLDGGELLLTTGIPLGGNDAKIRSYVDRLTARGVVALGLGLGAGTDSVPAELERACAAAALPLLVVPDGIPFMQVFRAYWSLVGKTAQADLAASLSLQTSLAQAATRPEAVAAVVSVLGKALGGWAVYLPADLSDETYWPLTESHILPPLREETKRFDLAGTRSAASFSLFGRDVLEYSIVDGSRTAGFLAVCAGRPLRAADRQLVLTGCMLLAVTAQREWQLTRANSIVSSTAATLLVNGFVDAARLVAEDLAGAPLAERVQLLAIRGDNVAGLSTTELAEQVASMVKGTGAERLRESIRHSRLRCITDGLTYLVLEPPSPLGEFGAIEAPLRGANYAAVISRAMLLSEVRGSVDGVHRACLIAPVGLLSAGQGLHDSRAAVWVAALTAYRRADLVGTVRSYLRHHGQWEASARELDLHRNSVRHRIGIATELIEADLNDPDVSAELWLALRGVEVAQPFAH
ncbi:PucR family transcriptional regulator [Cryobacterium psychrophilum]|uniref:PucR family transcriptional regulator n=1 Tax=Cryobacterium psychrophilum TaxID=41988 RepID=A0A4Y8KU98_9MICO|nr:PucR family transcriptional regulator [Cryobacterium psychrophilum]TDW28772.1 purine catabolism regulator [Cryobacterium psychrophilum]TFD82423.1 PucR family transcriptional regulator [Cryobacterium psychrophilum]